MKRGPQLRHRFHHGRAYLLLAAALAFPASVHAQGTQTLPGLVVTVPPAGGAPAPEARPAPKAASSTEKSKARATPDKSKSKSASLNTQGAGKGRGATQSIAVLVNDDPITGYEIEQRSRLMALGANVSEQAQANFKRLIQQDSTNQRLRAILQETIQANPGKSREQILQIFEGRKQQFAQQLQQQAMSSAKSSMLPTYRKGAMEELIEERLKLQEARRISVTVDDAQVDEVIKNIAERNKMTPQQFAQHLKGMGADIEAMKARFRATLSWNQVVRRRFAAQVSVNQLEIDRMISSSGSSGEDDIELTLHKITLPVPGKLDQKVMARRLDEAERIRRAYKGCNSSAAVAKANEAKFDNLGTRKPATVPEPTRSLLINAKDGEMVPPNMSAQGIELYAVCSRKVTKADDKKRDDIAADLQQKEFEVLAKRHLRDLRQDAHIEYR